MDLRQAPALIAHPHPAGADFIIDRGVDATMATYLTSPNDATLYADLIHPTGLGNSYLAPYYLAAINAL